MFLLNFIEFSENLLLISESISNLEPEFIHPIFVKPKIHRMKRRIRKIVNFFAFNLLFFALYLNFIHKDKAIAEPLPVQTNAPATITGTVPVKDVDKYINAKATSIGNDKTVQNDALKVSIN